MPRRRYKHKKLKDAGYQTEVMIKTTSAALSWESTNERYSKDKEAGNIARKVDKNHHDIVTGLLAENARKVFAEPVRYICGVFA